MSLLVDIRVERTTGFTLEAAFEVPAGSTVALLGPNGAGKSSVVWAIAGVEPITSGRIELDGVTLDDPANRAFVPPEERGIGALFQDVLLFPHLDVLANLAFAARRPGRSTGEAAEVAAGLLTEHGLEDLAGMRSDRLSGGQAQRVGLLRALAGDPALLLLDEPLSALDVGSRARVRRSLTRHLEGFTGPRLLVTHDPTEAALLADTLVVLEEGRVTQTGTPEEILRGPRTRYAADLAGLNLLAGTASDGLVTMEDGRILQVGDTGTEGAVLLTIHPRVVSIYPDAPSGSPRNTWAGTIDSIEVLTDGLCRVRFDTPVDLTAEITHQAREALGLRPGEEAWISIKATEIGVIPG